MRPTLDPDAEDPLESTQEVDHAVYPVAVLGPDSLVEALCPGADGIAALQDLTAASLRRVASPDDLGEPPPAAVLVAVGATDLEAGLCRVVEVHDRAVHVVGAVSGLKRTRGIYLPGLMEHLEVPLVDMDAPHGCDRLRAELLLALRADTHPQAHADRSVSARRALVLAALARHTSAGGGVPWVALGIALVALAVALTLLGLLG